MQASVSGLRLTSAALQPSSLSATLTVLLNPDSSSTISPSSGRNPTASTTTRRRSSTPSARRAALPPPAARRARGAQPRRRRCDQLADAVDARCRFGELSEVSASFDYTNASYRVPPRFECVAPTVAEMGNATRRRRSACASRSTASSTPPRRSPGSGARRPSRCTRRRRRGVEPGGGPVDGGTLVEVRGAHFAHGKPTRYRRFGAGVSPASYDAAAGSLRCVAPPQGPRRRRRRERRLRRARLQRERAAGVRARRRERVGGARALPAGGGDGGRVERDAHEAMRAAAAGGALRRGRARGDTQRPRLPRSSDDGNHTSTFAFGRAGARSPRAARRPRARRPPRLAGWQLLVGHHLGCRFGVWRPATRARGGGAMRGARGGVRRRRRAVPRLFRGVADDARRRAAGARPPSGADAAVCGASGLHPAGGEEADRAPHHRRARGAHARRRAVCGRADRRASRPVWRAVPDG